MIAKHFAACLIAAALPLASARADEGMWTFDAFPSAKVAATYGAAPGQAWLDHVRSSVLRLTDGCSSSLVSGEGLLLTNHHCVVGCAQALSTERADYVDGGFLAATRAEERKCPGQQAEILTAITDMTARVGAAIGATTGAALARARDAEIAAIEEQGCPNKATERCQVVTLFGGGQYKLYAYRKYSDVRLVFAPEYGLAQFGGDPDNFNYPRYGLDAAFLRLYENGRPAATPTHLSWSARPPIAGELVYAVGNPGTTQRLFTQAQVAMRREVSLPASEVYYAELRGRLIGAMGTDPERLRTGSEELFLIENSYKSYTGQSQALVSPDFAAKLIANEADLRARVAADRALAARIGDPWSEIARAQAAYRDIFPRYVLLESRAATSNLFGDARTIVRAAQERAKPNGARLPAYTDSALPLLAKKLTDPQPVYPWLEELNLAFWLSKVREGLGADAPEVRRLLGKESPEALAHRLIATTTLADPKVRAALFEGGLPAVRASSDPLIRLALATDADAAAARDRYRFDVDAPVTAAQSRIAQARFAAYGDALYPDATFTARITYGAVQGWIDHGRPVPPTTNFAGLFDRATGAAPFALPAKLLAAAPRVDRTRTLDFVTNLDVVGGNSGSPVLARDGSVIGALFDGNIYSLGGAFGYDPALNRSVVVSTVAVEEALATVYPAPRLIAELHGR